MLYGSELFTSSTSNSNTANKVIATPLNYEIGPNDVIKLVVYFSKLVEEFGTVSIGELLFCVVEKHHKSLKIKEKRGTKQQWSTLLGAVIKIEVDERRALGLTLKAVIKQLENDSLWKPLVLNGEEQFKKIYKQKHEPQTYKYAQFMHRSKDSWNTLIREEMGRFFKR